MSGYIKIALQTSWLIVLVYWLASAQKAKKAKSAEDLSKRFMQYWLPLIVAALLLGPGEWFGHSLLRENFVPHSDLVGNIGLAFCFTGMAIACWSRFLLGRNWSLSVQKKVGHELVTNGIYSVIRHPIYTGILMMFIGNVLIVGDYRGILAVAIVFISFWFKLLKEEKLLTQTFGQNYSAYRQSTKALIPFIL